MTGNCIKSCFIKCKFNISNSEILYPGYILSTAKGINREYNWEQVQNKIHLLLLP